MANGMVCDVEGSDEGENRTGYERNRKREEE